MYTCSIHVLGSYHERDTAMLIEKEIYTNCTVIISEDDETGEIDISWYRNDKPPKLIMTDLGEEDECNY